MTHMPDLPSSLEDIALLRESVDMECKLAGGRDGRGELPKDFWPSYSAFANAQGGLIILGLAEKEDGFELRGLADPGKVRRDLFNQLNDSQKVSRNLLADRHVQEVVIDGRSLLVVEVPAAARKQKPVYIKNNPMIGTFRRLNDGDRRCDDETVRRMLAEQAEDSRDNRLLRGYGLDDISGQSLNAYRQMLRDTKPEHPYLEEDEIGFLRQIGGWQRDRESDAEGLTVAGLLMFGRSESIREEFPNYFLDYQERPGAKTEARWIDRITLDGTWSGNLFDFYRRVYRKLAADLKVPFALKDGQRQDQTAAHTALREALVNTLVHADYTGRASVQVVKRPDMFEFRNPGLMRVSVEQAFAGGESDGRNRTLQQMFLLVGLGEKAGSGVPKIRKGWTDQHWRAPALYEKEEPSEQTLLELRMIDLLPADVIAQLKAQFGAAFEELSRDERVILATAATETTVNHARLSQICDQHSTDLTRMLQGLVQSGFLEQEGKSRGAVYYLPGTPLPSPDEAFLGMPVHGEGSELDAEGSELDAGAPNLSSEPSAQGMGKWLEGLDYPLIDDLEGLNHELRTQLNAMSSRARESRRVPAEEMRETITALCAERYLTLRVLGQLLGRGEDYLRLRYLNPMVKNGALGRAYPQSPNDPRQAYTSTPTKRRQA